MEILAVLVLFATVFVAVLAFSGGSQGARLRLESLRGGIPAPVEDDADEYLPFAKRVLVPMVRVPVQQMARLMPTAMLERAQQRLILAGAGMPSSCSALPVETWQKSFQRLRRPCVSAFVSAMR